MKYEVRVTYAHLDLTSGKEKKTTENYIIADAETWADAEQQLYTQMAKITNATIAKAIKISDIIDIVKSEGDFWYKVKLEIEVIDEVSGKNKPIKETILVQAEGFKDACDKAQEYCLEVVVPVEITSVAKSNIVDIFDDEFVPVVKVIADDENPLDELYTDGKVEELHKSLAGNIEWGGIQPLINEIEKRMGFNSDDDDND